MLKKIDHVGIAVNDLAAVIEIYRDAFQVEPDFEEVVSEQNVRVAGFQIGESAVEFLEPTSEDSPVAKYLKKKGPGIHHIAYQVKSLQETLDTLQAKGYELIDKIARTGAKGKQIAFLHPKSFNGILIELSEFE